MRRDVRRRLIEVAKAGATITYGELMREFHIPRGHPTPGKGIGHVVGQISEHEDANGRPLLSAIVVRVGSATRTCPHGHPGGGIFGIPTESIPAELRRDSSMYGSPEYTESEASFIVSKQEEAWRFWQANEDPDEDGQPEVGGIPSGR